LALGDSFTIGTGTTPDRSFPAILTRVWQDAGREVVLANPAVNGYTTQDLLVDELPWVASFHPTLLTILIGANDIVQGSPLERYRAQLARIYGRVRSEAPAARVIALPQPDWSRGSAGSGFGSPSVIAKTIDRFNAAARAEAERAGARWIDLFPLMRKQAERRMFSPDGLHPSAEAYAEWAGALAGEIPAPG